jgi:hypothetical protein
MLDRLMKVVVLCSKAIQHEFLYRSLVVLTSQ